MKRIALFSLLFLFITCSLSLSPNNEQTAFLGMSGSSGPKLTVHMIAHSHDDMGWLETVEGYYYGTPSRSENVQKVLDNTIRYLIQNPSKKFIYVEVGFFKMWWNDQDDVMKTAVKKMVQDGQLEFISGGYVMNDEADVYYEDAIEQFTLGHKFLKDTFGVTPDIGWQIDPFGHASAQAALFAQMGFKALFLGRIDYQDKEKRLNDGTMEMVWIPETSQGNENAILTHVNFFHYLDPPGYCFDSLCHDYPVSSTSEASSRADSFVSYFKNQNLSYQATNLIHTAGTDFSFMEPEMNFRSYDNLINYIQAYPEYNIQIEFSTPSRYLNSIYPMGFTFPTKTDDFFPYADNPNAYWTGYFTSRVAFKGLVRQSGRFLQAVKRLATQSLWHNAASALGDFEKVNRALYKLEEGLSIAQHHDAVSGTSKQHVLEDYKKRILDGQNAVHQDVLTPILKELVQKDLRVSASNFETCLLNSTAVHCEVTYKNLGTGTPVLLAIYNSGPTRSSTIQLKVPNGKVQATNMKGESLATDVICANATEATDCDLFFADNFKGYALAYYHLVPSNQTNQITPEQLKVGETYQINPSQTISPVGDLSSFNLKSCKAQNLQDCYSTQFNLKYDYYKSYQGGGQASGAYIFRSAGDSQPYAPTLSGKVYKGKNLLQIHLDNGRTLSNLRIYKDLAKGIELQTFVDSILLNDGYGKEVVLRVTTPSIQNDNTFYTDSMGMELQKRVVDFRPTWNLQINEHIAGNYYPVQSTILLKDEVSKESLAILPDRSQGGSSLKQGQIELMIHRRLVRDDARGVEEPLDELDYDSQGLRQWVTHVLLFNKPGYLDTAYRKIQTNIDMPNIVLFTPLQSGVSAIGSLVTDISHFSGLEDTIKWTSRPLSQKKFLFRFQNMHADKVQTVSNDVFNSPVLGRGRALEMSLSANQAKTEMVKKKFDWNRLGLNKEELARTDYLSGEIFSLRPLEMRTFVVEFN